jgi:membrane associated rhomboid family serine protease
MWVVKTIEWYCKIDLHTWGIYPLERQGLAGIITAPFIHKDFTHLLSNTFPLLISAVGIMYFYPKIAIRAMFLMYLIIGIWTWAFARPSYHIGASGLVYGYVFFLFFSGILRKDAAAMAISLLVTFLYGSIVWGILPVVEEVSWESHLMGALAGTYFAWYYRKSGDPTPKHVWTEDEEDTSIEYMGENSESEKTEHENNEFAAIDPVYKYHYTPEAKKEQP